ncbi:DUF6308 family protein [Planosporangium mesophilum]|uniref:Uncharacterized protein n=1 Tax=Planosporangium mesophilum TaxID=689768 RepID=A0A8J3X6H1_9ACTN|nr:DUF6308 family protein [Planosporangium mesophilum]NJC86210.1 hypothetical protein [Planosporangium mesophilum]GII25698.1 hypothetical protein Pme01_52950 [Planosporangium mesophilum]
MASRTPPIRVACHVIDDPFQVFRDYCIDYPNTLRRYDWAQVDRLRLSPEVVSASRSLFSRISREQELRLLSLNVNAPWDIVPPDARLHDADPLVRDGLYGRALTLYNHFLHQSGDGIADAKVSKSLHLTRPAFFPILDTQVLKLYRTSAQIAARDLSEAGSPYAPPRRAFWEAFRQDVIRAGDGLAALRDAARNDDHPVVAEAADQLSDVRIIDILAWSISRQIASTSWR